MSIKFNYAKLLGRMKERGVTQEMLATEINNTPSTLSLKFNNKAYFKQCEINTICNYLEIEAHSIKEYFFAT